MNNTKKWSINDLSFGLSAAIMPIVVMLYLYTQNYREISFFPIIVNGIFLSALTLAIFTGCRFFWHTIIAFLFALLFVVFVFSFRIYCEAVRNILPHGILITYFIISATTAVIIFSIRQKTHFDNIKKLGPIWLSTCLVMLILNGINAVVICTGDNDGRNKIKVSFRPSPHLPSPNIYWIHADGMIGFKYFKKYFNDNQIDFYNFLRTQDFIINEDANFESGLFTQCAVTALMCPYFYDNFLEQHINTHDRAMYFTKNLHLHIVDLAFQRLFANELYMGFLQKSYKLCFIPQRPNFFIYHFNPEDTTPEKIVSSFQETAFMPQIFDCFSELLPSKLFMNKLPKKGIGSTTVRQEQLAAGEWSSNILSSDFGAKHKDFFTDSLLLQTVKSPRIVIINQIGCHCPFIYNQSGQQIRPEEKQTESLPENYPPQHRLTAEIIMDNIAMIVKYDPDAIIVIQGDHGLHGTTKQQFINSFGQKYKSPELWNSVISAVRVPHKYRNGEEKHILASPLNISRYLLNSFVEKNKYPYKNSKGKNRPELFKTSVK